MKRYFLYFISLIAILSFIASCNTTSKMYRFDDKNRIYKGQLSESAFNTLSQFLTANSNAKLKDTIIIKYNYNNETCWDLLDTKDDAYIIGFVTRHKERVEQVQKNRQYVSLFDFREPGNNLNKIIKWDNSIIIDSSKLLFDLLFKERCSCGSSIIVMPDKRFVFLRSDSHSEALDMTQKQIGEILNKK